MNICSQEPIAETELISTDEPATAESLVAEPREDVEHSDGITVVVCADTGLLASPVCPHTEKKTFEPGKEPSATCGPEFHRESYQYRER